MAASKELRTRAVEAGRKAFKASLVARVSGRLSDNADAFEDGLAAAEPFIRELVVAEVVEWLHQGGAPTGGVIWDDHQSCGRSAADAIRRQFGGSR